MLLTADKTINKNHLKFRNDVCPKFRIVVDLFYQFYHYKHKNVRLTPSEDMNTVEVVESLKPNAMERIWRCKQKTEGNT
ncbi:hypothetical protein EGR_00369 [Echinococcus granulosus]|uniref:Uncharacterized protein n=1 Tax=Echinococcus granulosus TaxID=6210 RepID=W6UTY8_ECHGR|nr:hypothetical protein EGR_00369 [Echinococcus granulosus]EUB65100.1 hypothetical protein EGR_00369 [Echinococcus granulosus]